MADELNLTRDKQYQEFLAALKERIQRSKIQAALAVNHELVLLYWRIGKEISQKFSEYTWGTKIIDQLAADLKRAYPEWKGFSPRNLRYMRSFAEAWPDEQILQVLPAKITWYHNCTLLDKVKDPTVREWYIAKTIEEGWSRDVLVLQIERDYYNRQGKAETNFAQTLPKPQSELARQMLKDPYKFDFLDASDEALEREIHKGLVEHIREFLLELGAGFAFVASNYHLVVGEKDFYLDLLFYHVKLHCYVVIDLKSTDFEPEYVGKMNFYLSAVDDIVKTSEDNPSIGLILCKSKNKVEAEYALRGVTTPIGIAGYETQLTKALPDGLKGKLPTIEELEAELENTAQEEKPEV